MKFVFKQKTTWLGLAAVAVALIVFGAAMMGSIAGTKPKDIPVALVVLDRPAELQGGGTLAAGETISQKLTANSQLPISWKPVKSEAEARAGLNAREYYGALILPAELSSGIASIAGPAPSPAAARILINEGMNTQASSVVKQVLNQAMGMVGGELSKSLLQQLGAKTGQIPATSAQALLAPVQVRAEIVHPVGANNAGGNAPGLLTQITWMSSLVTGLVLFLAGGGALKASARRWQVLAAQPVLGVIVTGLASAFAIWMASSWYGMEFASKTDVWLFLWLVGAAFFLLQSALLHWIGIPAMGLLVLLMFFSMPLLNMAPEFLSQTTRDWIYSWTPLRIAASGMRETMYFGGLDAADKAGILWSIGGSFLVLLLASGLKKTKRPASAAAGQPSAGSETKSETTMNA